MWMIAYKPGRSVAMPEQFSTKEQAQAVIDAGVDGQPFDHMHAIETDGKLKVTYPKGTP